MTSLAIVDSPEAVRAACAAMPGCRLATDNPILAHAQRDLHEIENIDARLSQADTARLGRESLNLSHAIDEALDTPALATRVGFTAGTLYLTGSLSRLISSLVHRAAALARELRAAAPSSIALFLLDQALSEARHPLLSPRFAHPARPLGERGFFGALPVAFTPIETRLPTAVNETAAREVLRRLVLLPVGVVILDSLRRLFGTGRGPEGLVVGEVNEALRETLAHLAWRGWLPHRRGALVKGLPIHTAECVTMDPRVGEVVEPLLRRAFTVMGEFDAPQVAAITRLVLEHLELGLNQLGRESRAIEERLENWFGSRGGVFLSNGLFGPAGAQAHAACRRRGIAVVEFEHGVTAGIAQLTDVKLREGRMPTGDVVLASSDRAVTAFGRNPRPHRTVAIGLADHTRRLLHAPLQRILARRACALPRGVTCVMHVSTLPYFGNHRPGLGAPSETTTFALDRMLIEEVYPRLRHHVLFKQYPTQRFPFEPGYGDLFARSPRLRLLKDEDFRYIRAAADVIVTSTPTSTLGWCVGTGRPLVWLDSAVTNPLSDTALRDAFRAAFLFIDIDATDWPQRLVALLDRDLQEIHADWAERRKIRDQLLRDAIVGPPGRPGRRAAEIVAELVAARNPLTTAAALGTKESR